MPNNRADQYEFDATRFMLFVATGVMWATATKSLHGVFNNWIVAMGLAGLLIWLFTTLAGLAFSRELRWYQRGFSAAVVAALATVTIGLSGAALWANNFANASLKGYFERHRIAAERHLSDVQAQTTIALKAVTDWSDATTVQAQREREQGGSCPNFAQSVPGERGPVFMFRTADHTVAKSVKTDLAQWGTALSVDLENFKGVGQARSFEAIQTGLNKANAAIEAALPLSQGGAVPTTLLKELESRLQEPVAKSIDGTGIGCGDAARDQLILKAREALNALSRTPKLDRIAVPVDLSDPHDVVTRGWLRAANIALASLPFVHVNTFKDDVLWTENRARQGLANSESLPFFMVAIVEISVLLIVYWRTVRPGGQAPFASTLVTTVQRWVQDEAGGGGTETRTRSLSATLQVTRATLAKAYANFFYTSVPFANPQVAPQSASVRSATAPTIDLDGGNDAIQLPNHPLYGDRTTNLAMQLLHLYVDWGSAKLLVIPRLGDPDCERAHRIARFLSTKGLLELASASATVDQFRTHPSAELVLGKAVPQWKEARNLEVWTLKAPFAAFLDRLAALDTTQPANMVTTPHRD